MRADKDSVTRLLKTARGQLDGILKMIDEDRYCVDISNQIIAVQSILKKVNRDIIAAHMQGCVKEAMCCGEDSQQKINEMISLIDKLSK